MTSPWLSVFTSSPGITIRSRSRATRRSRVRRRRCCGRSPRSRRAPPPRRGRAARRRRRAVADQCVCMWRSTTIIASATGSRSGRCEARRRPFGRCRAPPAVRRLGRRLARSARACGGVLLPRVVLSRRSGGARRPRARAGSRAGRLDESAPCGRRLVTEPAKSVGGRHDDRGGAQEMGARVARRGPCARGRGRGGAAGSTAGLQAGRCAARSLPVLESREARAARRARPRVPRRDARSTTTLRLRRRARRGRDSTPAGRTVYVAREPLGRARAAASSLVARACRSARAGGRGRRRGGKASRSGSTKVAAVVVSASRSAT